MADLVERAHGRARRGEPGRLYAVVRVLAGLVLRSWFRVRVSGEALPDGPVVVAANHKSFLDAFFIGLATRRRVRFMAKAELFRGPLARLLPALGAFPVRRRSADAAALETAVAILREDGVVVVFPEGTRVDEPDALGSPHHGAGRLALETGAPIVPTAVFGTSHLWLGPMPKPRRVGVSFLAPVPPPRPGSAEETREALEELIDREVWPAVQTEYGRLRATPGSVALAMTAIGLGGVIVRRQRSRDGLPRLLGKLEPGAIRRRRRRAALDRLLRR